MEPTPQIVIVLEGPETTLVVSGRCVQCGECCTPPNAPLFLMVDGVCKYRTGPDANGLYWCSIQVAVEANDTEAIAEFDPDDVEWAAANCFEYPVKDWKLTYEQWMFFYRLGIWPCEHCGYRMGEI